MSGARPGNSNGCSEVTPAQRAWTALVAEALPISMPYWGPETVGAVGSASGAGSVAAVSWGGGSCEADSGGGRAGGTSEARVAGVSGTGASFGHEEALVAWISRLTEPVISSRLRSIAASRVMSRSRSSARPRTASANCRVAGSVSTALCGASFGCGDFQEAKCNDDRTAATCCEAASLPPASRAMRRAPAAIEAQNAGRRRLCMEKLGVAAAFSE